jgi:hypothetical protein
VYNINGDTGLSRLSAGVIGVGTGAAGSTAGELVAIDVQATWNGTVGTSPQVLAGDVLCARSSTTGAILFGIGTAGVGASNYWYWDGTNMNLGAGSLVVPLAITANNANSGADVIIQGIVGNPNGVGAIYCGVTPSATNYALAIQSGNSNLFFNATTSINFSITGSSTPLVVTAVLVTCENELNVVTGYQANGTAGVSAGPFTAVTSITSKLGIVTALSGTSDERLKDAELYEGGLGVILAINPVRYKWNAKGQVQTGLSGDQEFVGFIAQDVQRAIPEAITATEPSKDGTETYLSLDDRPILAAAVNAIKELNARIVALEAKQKG